jgi:cell wall-active antibiotic response 4TMS protein YvqF
MNCATHNTVAAVAYCRTCGKALCAACARDVRGTKFCEQCLADRIGDALPAPLPPGASVPGGPPAGERLPSPGLAAVLGFIPGVGAMYNGQFMKGFVHVMAFVCLIWMADHFGPIMVPVFFAYFFYLVFDAYKTAHALELGQPVPDPFGFERMFGPTPQPRLGNPGASSVVVSTSTAPAEPARYRSSVPTGAVILIVLGLIFLLNTVGLFESGIDRFWPIILIGFGGWLFARRWGLLGQVDGTCTCDRCKMRCIMWPAIMVTLGVLFLIDNLHGPGFERTWPLILLVIGGVKLLQSNASEAGHIEGPGALSPPPPPPGVTNSEDPQGQAQASSEVNHV